MAKRDFAVIAKYALAIIQIVLSIAVIAWVLFLGVPHAIQQQRQINETQARIDAITDSLK